MPIERSLRQPMGAPSMSPMKQAPTFETQFVEFDGIVESPTTLTETERTPFGNIFGEHSALLLCYTLSAWQSSTC